MALTEFQLIRRHFTHAARRALLGIGDDAALIEGHGRNSYALTVDTMNEGVHFLAGADARNLGHKSLAVNLSDLAAMGAAPRYALLALTLPSADERWLEAFSAGFFSLAQEHGVELIGGDTTRGPLSISVTAIGELTSALRRDGARAGDDVWVSGELGGAALGLACLQGRAQLPAKEQAEMVRRLEQPRPQVALGLGLCAKASAAIDLSDGLTGDLAHVLERSAVSARIEYALIPRPAAFARLNDAALEQQLVLAGGDDYELLFTAPAARRGELEALGSRIGLALARVGTIEKNPDGSGGSRLTVLAPDGKPISDPHSHDHFAAP